MLSIKSFRVRRGLTQQQLAHAMNVDRSTVAKWETAGGYPNPKLFPELARILECTIDELFVDDEKGGESA